MRSRPASPTKERPPFTAAQIELKRLSDERMNAIRDQADRANAIRHQQAEVLVKLVLKIHMFRNLLLVNLIIN